MDKIGLLVAIFSALSATKVESGKVQQTSEVSLWRNLKSGMIKNEVNTLYLKKKAESSPGCEVDICPKYKNGRLVTVVIIDRSNINTCRYQAVEKLNRPSVKVFLQRKEE